MPSDAVEAHAADMTKNADQGETEEVKNKRQNSAGGSPSAQWPGGVPANGQFPPPKTDKPRPHVCATCNRSFARLEHLKRHERSHTKEKPFECPECTRCFARRDLLLRHQQKLHLTTTPSSRPRNGRRESTSSSIASAKVRKNSQSVQNGTGSMRPRANTISHIDGAALGIMEPLQQPNRRRNPNIGHHRHSSLTEYGEQTLGSQRGAANRMLKINTHGLTSDMGGTLRTAPAFGAFSQDANMGDLVFGGGNTVNPAQLHFAESPSSMQWDTPASPPLGNGYTFGRLTMVDDDGNFDWINGFDNQMTFGHSNEHAIAGSSPSAMSGGSPCQGDAMLDSQTHLSPEDWQDSLLSQAAMVQDYSWGLTADTNPDPMSSSGADLPAPEVKFTPPFNGTNSVHMQPAFANTLLNFGSATNSPNTASVSSGSNRHSSVTSVATEMVTDATRQSLLALLAQSSAMGQRKYSQPAVSSPLSPGYQQQSRGPTGANLPVTSDLQRYINSYIHNFHPRLPFLHIATLNFDTLGAANNPRAKAGFSFSTATGDGGCLLLSMAAIGAQFEFDYSISKDLFDLAKRLIHLYLEERRRADMCAAIGVATNSPDSSTPSTPLWLVQSMLLNVVYGHNTGDRAPADLAGTHCAALVSLARAAGLTRASDPLGMDDIHMGGDPWGSGQHSFDETTWYTWKIKEEKRRTLYSIFVVSSVLVSIYNFPPCLTNSEIGLDLPCDESLWSAENPTAWFSLGGNAMVDHGIPFAKALSSLLTTSQRFPLQPHQLQAQSRAKDAHLSTPDLPPAAFYSSSFGCLVLVNALHNYIWETRQRHIGRQWTTQETEAMQAHIGPALLAFQAVWRESSQRAIQRPNQPPSHDLAADCVPFLDLAFVRLFLSLGRSKECFWTRDWDGMAHEIASGCEVIPRSDSASSASPDHGIAENGAPREAHVNGEVKSELSGPHSGDQSSKRERHLRKAAAHAAHSLHTADVHGVSLADFPSREVNLGAAICALDCNEILAEWVSVVQERVGRYLGMLGRDEADFESVPGIILLESEDAALLQRIEAIVRSAEHKLDTLQKAAGQSSPQNKAADRKELGLAARLLKVTARECDCAATWSVMNLMARNFEAHAEYMQARAEKSLLKTE